MDELKVCVSQHVSKLRALLESDSMMLVRRSLLVVCFSAVFVFGQTPSQAPSEAPSQQSSPTQPQAASDRAPGETAQTGSHVIFRVTFASAAASKPVSGRLLLLMTSNPKPVKNINLGFENIDASDVWMAAKEISSLAPGASIDVDADELAYPTPFSKAAAGEYQVQAVLDTNHDYAYYNEPDAGDLISEVGHAKLASAEPIALSLTSVLPEAKLPKPAHASLIDFQSKRLSAYWGRPMHIRGWLVLPPSYQTNKT